MGSRLLAFTFVLVLFSLPALAQMPGNPPQPPELPSQPSIDPGAAAGNNEEAIAEMRAELEKKAEVRRIEQLKDDTDKLLKLSEELKTYVDKTNTNVLSLDVIKKAQEIEKLAKSVHDKMRGPN